MKGIRRGSSPASRAEGARWRARDWLRRSDLARQAVVRARHRGLAADDLFIASYPRSGNTWLRFVLADLATGSAVADFEHAERLIPYVGAHRDTARLAGSGRMIKTHEPHRADYRRGIYLVRDVRDVLVSWYRFTRDDPDDLSHLDGFVASFLTRDASPYGSWADHVQSWLRAADRSDLIQVRRYEHLRTRPIEVITDLAEFAGIDMTGINCARVKEALGRNTRADMRRHEQVNLDFLRRSFGLISPAVGDGAAGKWREVLSDRHLRTLRPALALNTELGYDES